MFHYQKYAKWPINCSSHDKPAVAVVIGTGKWAISCEEMGSDGYDYYFPLRRKRAAKNKAVSKKEEWRQDSDCEGALQEEDVREMGDTPQEWTGAGDSQSHPRG